MPGGRVSIETCHQKANRLIAFLIHLPVLWLLCRILYQRSNAQPLLAFFWWGLLGKLLAGVGIGLLYSYYYPYRGDTFAYFDDAARLASFAWQEPVSYLKILFFTDSGAESFPATLPLWEQPRAFFMVKLVSVLCLFTFNNYWLCSLYLTLFCFYELWKLANCLSVLFPSSHIAAALAFLLLPSVMFWSAGLTKESIAMACIAGIVRLFITWRFTLAQSGNVSFTLSWLRLPLYLLLLWKLKYYYLSALLPSILAFIVTDLAVNKWFSRIHIGFKISLLVSAFAAILVTSTFLHPNLRIPRFVEALVTNHDLTVVVSAPHNIIHFTGLQPTPESVLKHLPEALFSGLYRPLLWEGTSLFQWYIGFENLLLLALTLFVLLTRRNIWPAKPHTYVLLLVTAFMYISLLAALLALSSPNFGALSRYKVAFMPFFAYMLLWAVFPETNKKS